MNDYVNEETGVLNNNCFAKNLTSKKVLVNGILWNFSGQLFPIIVAVFTIPWIIKGLGTEKFGILTIIWTIIGYASLFDLGLGRALTQLVSKKIGLGETKQLPSLMWTAIIMILVLSLIGAIFVIFLAPLIVDILKVSKNYRTETLNSLYLMAVCIPILVTNSCFKGILDSFQKFKITTVIRIPLVIINFIGPLIVLVFTKNLAFSVALLVLTRFVTLFAFLFACFKTVDNFFKDFRFNKEYIEPLFSFGGWMTVSNIISPFLHCFDRFFIANMLSASVIAYYTIPYEIIMKLLLIPAAIMGVMFPAFSTELTRDTERTARLYNKSQKYIFFLLLPVVIFILFFAKLGLSVWINEDFAAHSYKVVQILTISILINSLAHPGYYLIQAFGKADLTAKIHLIELPIYLISLFILIKMYGINGAAIAWLIRSIADLVLFNIVASKLMRINFISDLLTDFRIIKE